ncbi:hypothetical protein WJX72_009754 [[Myrmecia] bisecta]|uniref:SHSP domain-containing protein n=1 Tax=[Myrmecia] bisecta TaxID=41462 RepID=A0AAW1P7R7_9CHLO
MSLLPFTAANDDFFSTALHNFLGASNGTVARSGGDNRDWTRGIMLDVKETESAFEVKADLPGLSKQDIKVQVNGDVLSLSVDKSAGKEEVKEENGVKYHRVERSSTFASRAIRMPETADLSNISARYQDGVLHLDVHKHKDKIPKHRQITIE